MAEATVTKAGGLAMQVCVPREWTDEQATEFANSRNPSGLDHGWFIRRQGSELLAGKDERVTCQQCAENVHIMLDC